MNDTTTPTILTIDVEHKIREHLTIVMGSLELLHRQSLDDRGREHLKRAVIASDEISAIITKVFRPL